ncbi:MAG TPA: hypothetical protein VII99_10010, partial [Bacteroidia bacterium]
FLRPLLFPLLWILFIGVAISFRARFGAPILLLISGIILTTAVSIFYTGEFNLSNNLLSLFFLLPPILIFFSRPQIHDTSLRSYFDSFIYGITALLIANNCIGFVQHFLHPESDDSFIGFYGTHGLGLHTLSMVNFLIGMYHFFNYQQTKNKKHLLIFLFFVLSAIFCFYGLGLIVFFLSIIVYNLSLRNFIKTILIGFLSFCLLATSLYFFRHQTFVYNYENIQKAQSFFQEDLPPKYASNVPRKLILYRNYVRGFGKDAMLFLFGSGPGTFNSRSYFLLNGDYSKSKFIETLLGKHEPKYAAQYVHVLWNSEDTSQQKYTDGTRNEPFSSFIALLAEYGVVIFFFLLILTLKRYKYITQSLIQLSAADTKAITYGKFVKFSTIYIGISLLADNYLEYPEIMLIYVLSILLITIYVQSQSHRPIINENTSNP